MRRHNAPVVVTLTVVAIELAGGCSTTDDRLGVAIDPPTRGFGVGDAGPIGAEAGLLSYCPTDKCPPGFTTCPSSRFPCDVNLRTDINNCGACGATCPVVELGAEAFACVEGDCAMQCVGASLDCDGLADDGCEADPREDEHCGSCTKRCLDPAKPCSEQAPQTKLVDCGCPLGKLSCDRVCIDTRSDDRNCGGCGTYCDPTGDGAPAQANAYYGCSNSRCGELKCKAPYADCDSVPSNGCETSLVTDTDCGACGNACPAGQACHLDVNRKPQCMCPPGTIFCQLYCLGSACVGICTDLTSDRVNCGACGVGCSVDSAVISPNAQSSCNYGMCETTCEHGYADCNVSASDGCETNTGSDPRNCGSCGHVCDAVAGQACVAGRCVVEPCNADGGGVAR